MRSWTLLAVLAICTSPMLADNNATITEESRGAYATNSDTRLDEYLEQLLRNPDDLAKTVSGDLMNAVPDVGKPAFGWDFRTNYYSVVFAATRAGASAREVVRFTLHNDGKRITVVDHLPGITDLHEVFLSADPHADIATLFSTKAVPNPIEAQALKAVKQIQEPLANLGSKVGAKPLTKLTLAPSRIYIVLRSVKLADPRSTVSVTTTIHDESSDFVRDTLRKQVNNTAGALSQGVTLISKCADDLAGNMGDDSVSALENPVDDQKKPIPPPLARLVSAAERKQILTKLRSDDPPGTIRTTLDSSSCKSDKIGPDAPARMAAVVTVEDRMLGIFTAKSDPVTGSHQFSDTPLEHFDLGAAGGAILDRRGAVRAKNNNGTLVEDPVSGLLMMAVLHWHPIAFDSQTATPTSAERFSVLFGFVVKPEPGLAAGLSWSIFRGLNVHVSHAWMLVDQLNKGVKPNTAAKDVTDRDPFRHGWTKAWTVGFGYNFE